MNDTINPNKELTFSINNSQCFPQLSSIAKALSSKDRLRILNLIQSGPKNLYEISKFLNMPNSSVSKHVNVLADAGLLFINFQPSKKGHVKLCNKTVMSLSVDFENIPPENSAEEEFVVEMPVGHFCESNISAPCGMAGSEDHLNNDDPNAFFSPERIKAELLWFESGFISYKFPTVSSPDYSISEISFSFEVCSEAVYYRNNWPSDITILINDIEITTFTSPGDFGGKRGKYTPKYWFTNATQFGILKTFAVNEIGTFVDSILISHNPKLNELRLDENNFIKLSIGVKETALHKGGINLFGKRFGNYPQAIIMTMKRHKNNKQTKKK